MQPQMQTPATSDASGGEKLGNLMVLDHHRNPFNVTIFSDAVGTATYTVQVTPEGTLWYDHPSGAGLSTDALLNIAFPVLGVRIKQTAGAGSVNLRTIQAG